MSSIPLSLITRTGRDSAKIPRISCEAPCRNTNVKAQPHLAIVDQPAFYHKGDLRMYLKETARNVIINEHVRLYELGANP